MESTHLTNLKKISILFGLLAIAFVWSNLVGIFKDKIVKKIKFKNDGYRAISVFRYGLDCLCDLLSNLGVYESSSLNRKYKFSVVKMIGVVGFWLGLGLLWCGKVSGISSIFLLRV